MVWEVLRLNVSFVCFLGAGRMFQWEWEGLGYKRQVGYERFVIPTRQLNIYRCGLYCKLGFIIV